MGLTFVIFSVFIIIKLISFTGKGLRLRRANRIYREFALEILEKAKMEEVTVQPDGSSSKNSQYFSTNGKVKLSPEQRLIVESTYALTRKKRTLTKKNKKFVVIAALVIAALYIICRVGYSIMMYIEMMTL